METKTKALMIFLMLVLLQLGIVLALPASASDRYYELKLHYDKGKLSLNGVSVRPGGFSAIEPGIGYKAELLSFEGKPLSVIRFEIPLEIVSDEVDLNTSEIISGTITREIVDFIVRMKYATNGKVVNIYNPKNERELSIDVGYFAKVCGDGTCQAHERYESCPQDCKDVLKPELEKKKFNWYLVALIILGIIIAIFLIYKLMHRQRR
ncbi:hypothetical protein HYU07_01110 [Candidatus Woesearchaeota archaeon]|nr:hypothetical protein [Candidatus Woesearchaeota archaeon]